MALYEGTWQKFRTGDVTRINDLLDIAAESAWEVIDSKQYEIFKPAELGTCLLYTSPSPRDRTRSRMPSSA